MDVYCITGYPGSGKSTATDYLDGKIPVVVMGDIVRRLAKEKGGISEKNGREVGSWATKHREEKGKTVFARETCKVIENTYPNSDKIVIDGIRSLQELEVFKNNFSSVTIVYIKAPFETRYKRITSRGRDSEEENYTKETLRDRDAQEKDWGLNELVNHADECIENTDSLEAFYTELDNLLQL